MPSSPRESIERDGYYIAQVLEGDELAGAQRAAEVIYAQVHGTGAAGGNGRHGQGFLQADSPLRPFFYLLHDPRITGVAEQALGGKVVWEGASLLCSAPRYTQGWHRDVLQIPEDKIDDRWFSPDVFFNNIQLNLPFFDDACLWIVPGSHRRPLTPAEAKAFAGSRHITADGVEMPGGIPVELKAGQCVFYNNNLIHRGHNGRGQKRVTYHSGYARTDVQPSWHFYGARRDPKQEEFLRSLGPEMRSIHEEYHAALARFPDFEKSWRVAE
ncbi:MAG: phytanoyl-CoA dioxygenase family protein [Planctomycetota bacterium]|nr:phytanoyl-CoA dioxygenase family protein [Planctomycetota bacterium]